MVNTCNVPNLTKPTVNVYICHESDPVFDRPETYRERIMLQGSYRGHTFGPPALLKCIDERNIALSHPDPGKIIWAYVVKYVLTVFALEANMLHIKGAAVAYKGKAFLFLGRGGSGKTEILKELCKSGAGLLANTHLLIDGELVSGVKSNMRVRENGGEVYVSVGRQRDLNVHEGWLPIGGVFWVKYRTDGKTMLEVLPPSHAKANVQYFSEAIRNWELKEDIADYSMNIFDFAEMVNRADRLVNKFCESNHIHFAHLDIFSNVGKKKLMSVMEAGIRSPNSL